MSPKPRTMSLFVSTLGALALASLHAGAEAETPRAGEVRYFERPRARAAIAEAVAAGLIPDPSTKLRQRLPESRRQPVETRRRALTPADIFPFEDSGSVLLGSFTDGQLLDLMADAANAVTAVNGDVYDFIGFWLAYEPHHEIGAAFYLPIFNDVAGIGDASSEGTPIFDDRANLGLNSTEIEGYVMMWNIDESYWQPGTASNAKFTRLALAQEFEHRYALFLPPLLDGRVLQGIQSGCGRQFHWSWRVDGQGSGMEIAEWVNDPPFLAAQSISFNTDIGGVFSYTDLYLMGIVSAAEMDAGNSELRYMETSNCISQTSYFGPVSTFSSADIIAAAGARVPDHTTEQSDYRSAWVMLHLPGQPPTLSQLDKAVLILEQQEIDWREGTLFRSTMDNSLGGLVAVPAGDETVPSTGLFVGTPRPNPTAGGASIPFTLSEPGAVTVSVHDVAGRRVAELWSGFVTAGTHSVTWDGAGPDGRPVAAGPYFVRIGDKVGAAASRLLVIR